MVSQILPYLFSSICSFSFGWLVGWFIGGSLVDFYLFGGFCFWGFFVWFDLVWFGFGFFGCFWIFFPLWKKQPSQTHPIYITAEIHTLAALKPATPCYINVLNIAFQNQFLVSLATQAAKSSPAWCSAASVSFQVNWKSFDLELSFDQFKLQVGGDSFFAYSPMKAIISMFITGIYKQ